MAVDVNRATNAFYGSPFTDIIDTLADYYDIGLEKGTARGHIGTYQFTLNGESYYFTTWQDTFKALIQAGIPIDLKWSQKGLHRFTLKMSQPIPQKIVKKVVPAVVTVSQRESLPQKQEVPEISEVSEDLIVDEEVEVVVLRDDFENIPWPALGSPRYSKDQVISLAGEFGISLEPAKKQQLISQFEEAVEALTA